MTAKLENAYNSQVRVLSFLSNPTQQTKKGLKVKVSQDSNFPEKNKKNTLQWQGMKQILNTSDWRFHRTTAQSLVFLSQLVQ